MEKVFTDGARVNGLNSGDRVPQVETERNSRQPAPTEACAPSEESLAKIYAAVHRVCRALLGDRDFNGKGADDVTQDIVTGWLLRKTMQRYDPAKGQLIPYLAGAARLRCRDLLWKAPRLGRIENIAEPATGARDDPALNAQVEELASRIGEAIENFPPHLKDAIEDLIRVPQNRNAEGGKRTSTSYVHRHRAREQLRERLGDLMP